MTVAEADRRYFDADSHVLEPNDWLHAVRRSGHPRSDADVAHPLAPDNADARPRSSRRAGPDDEALIDEPLWGRGYAAFGAWDASERSAILDKYGIDAAVRVLDVRAGPVPLQGSRPAVRRGPRAHPGARRLLLARPPSARRPTHPVGRRRPRPRRARCGARAGVRRRAGPVDRSVQDHGPEPSRRSTRSGPVCRSSACRS